MCLPVSDSKNRLYAVVEELQEEMEDVSHWLYENPELPKEEFQAVEKLTQYLQEKGFEVKKKVAGLETAFMALYSTGEGGPRLGFLAEYDGLPHVGHGCGHNLIAVSCVGAAVALSRLLQRPAQLVVFGTPDEEYDGGKATMAQAGLFSDLDMALQIHPSSWENYVGGSSTPHQTMVISFFGQAAHTSGNPTQGINALNGVLITFAGLHAMQQYLQPGARIPATITHGGGAPNAVPDFAQLRVHVTAREPDYLLEVVEAVENCARAGSLATKAQVEIWKGPIYKVLKANPTLTGLLEENIKALGYSLVEPPPPTSATDVGNVSWECPTSYAHLSLNIPGTPGHTREFAKATISPQGKQLLLDSAKAMAATALDILEKPENLGRMRQEFQEWKEKESAKLG